MEAQENMESEESEIASLRAELQVYRDRSRGDYWVWQGDGEDHLESLVCPVLIQPRQLMTLQDKGAS